MPDIQTTFLEEVKKLPEGGVLIVSIADQTRENYSICIQRDTLAHFAEIVNAKGSSVGACVVSLLMRPGSMMFWAVLEHTWFVPTGPNEKSYLSAWTRWQGQYWTIGVIPADMSWAYETTAKLTNMAINKNPPVVLMAGSIRFFPIQWAWTLENCDHNSPHYQATADGLEKLLHGEIGVDELFNQVLDSGKQMARDEFQELKKFYREHGIS